MDVAEWLRALGLAQYEAAFHENDIDAVLLSSLTADDLRDLGVASVGHRRRLLNAIAQLAPPPDAAGPMALPAPEAIAGQPSEGGGERRHVSVMFCDLAGSTPLAARLDPEDLSEVIRAYQDRVKETVLRFGGYVARYIGDGVLIYFGWPRAEESDAEQAVRAGLAVIAAVTRSKMGGEPLRMRVGIATGLVVVGHTIVSGASRQIEVVGETPNRAARLQDMAGPNGVIIDLATRQRLGGLFELRDMGPVPLKGLDEPVPAWSVLGENRVRDRFEALHGTRLTPMIGREEELELLLRRWRQATAGSGRMVIVSGEAGIGKSRLIAALEEQLRAQPHTRLRYFCSPWHRDTPLEPIIGQLEFAAGFARGDSAEVKRGKLRETLVKGTAEEDFALIASMLSLPDPSSPLALSPSRQKELTFEAMNRQFVALARRQPLLVLVEDVHWSDPTSRALFDQTIEMLPELPVLLVMTVRPDFQAPWIGHSGVSLMTLSRLDRHDAAAMALRVAASAIPADVITRVVAQSDGVPLFIEELTRGVLDAGSGNGAGQSRLAVPDSLQASLLARLDRLPPAKAVAQIASVLGRGFSHELIHAAAELCGVPAAEGLAQLVAAELVFQRGEAPSSVYMFKHALVQDAAYQSLLRGRRIAIHAAAAEVLERDLATAEPAVLGHHCAEAGLTMKAAEYYLRAGEQSAARSAMAEALAHISRGLDLAAAIEDTTARLSRQAPLQFILGNVQGALHGYAAPECGTPFEAAVAHCRELDPATVGRDRVMAPALFGLCIHQSYAGVFQRARLTAEELLALGRDRDNAKISILGGLALGLCALPLGFFTETRDVLTEAIAACGRAGHPPLAMEYGLDPEAVLHTQLSRVLACMGLPEQAQHHTEAGITRARETGHVRTLAIALGLASDTFLITRDIARLRAHAAEFAALAAAQGFPFWILRGQYYEGYLAALDGKIQVGRDLIARSLAGLRQAGAGLTGPEVHASLSDTQLALGDRGAAAGTLAAGQAIAANTGEAWWEAELFRREALLAEDPAVAEARFRLALDTARRQSALWWELRAATGLGRLLTERNRPGEARAVLAPVLASLTEGRDYPDAREAAALLDNLG